MPTSDTAESPPCVILDRDGVVNEDSDAYIKSPAEWRALPGSLEAMGRLSRAGYAVVIATNQSGLARGLFDEAALAAIHGRMREAVAAHGGQINAVYHCPHGPEADCACRKPRPGLLLKIARDWGMELAGVPFVGDSYRDLQAARAAGAAPVLVRTGKGERTLAEYAGELADVTVAPSLAAFVDAWLGRGSAG